MIAGASDGAAVERSAAASGKFRRSSTGRGQACGTMASRLQTFWSPLTLVTERGLGVGAPLRLRLGHFLGLSRPGLLGVGLGERLLDERLHRLARGGLGRARGG